jgi:hypothetical protein
MKVIFLCLQQAGPLLDERNINKLVDPQLGSTYNVCQMQAMISAAALCVQQSSQHRPQISQVSSFPRKVHLQWENLDLTHLDPFNPFSLHIQKQLLQNCDS